MKTNFHQKNNGFGRAKTTRKSVFVPLLCTFLLGIIFSIPVTRGWLLDLAHPIWSARNALVESLANDVLLLQSKQSLLDQNKNLELQLAQHAEDLALSSVLREQNADLEQILGRNNTQKQILATILDKPLFSPYDTLVIDVGTADGVMVSDTVFVLGDIPIGFISEAAGHTSKVILFSAPGQTTNVLIGTDHVEKQAVGIGGGNFEVEMPRESSIHVGDPVVIPSISPNIFATVSAVEFKEADSFQNVRFTMPINIAQLQWVEVSSVGN